MQHAGLGLDRQGTWMIVEPMAGNALQENLNPVGRLFYAASTMICLPTSRAQEVGAALGAQAGESRLREVILQGGFPSVPGNRDAVQHDPGGPAVGGIAETQRVRTQRRIAAPRYDNRRPERKQSDRTAESASEYPR
jgi:hypothetical protein